MNNTPASFDRLRMNGNRVRMNGDWVRMNGNRVRMNDNRVRMNGDWVRMNGSPPCPEPVEVTARLNSPTAFRRRLP